MPAEWEPHEATWLAWPHELTDWPGKFAPIPWVYGEIVRHLASSERVYLLVQDRAAESRVRAILKSSGVHLEHVDFFRVSTNRGWMRDSGPICVKSSSGEVAFTHWLFNMIALWMFGAAVENAWGTRRFLELYFIGVIGAAFAAALSARAPCRPAWPAATIRLPPR